MTQDKNFFFLGGGGSKKNNTCVLEVCAFVVFDFLVSPLHYFQILFKDKPLCHEKGVGLLLVIGRLAFRPDVNFVRDAAFRPDVTIVRDCVSP